MGEIVIEFLLTVLFYDYVFCIIFMLNFVVLKEIWEIGIFWISSVKNHYIQGHNSDRQNLSEL